MAWHNIAFTFGSTLTASKIGGLQDNFTALAENATGSPTFSSRSTKIVVFSGNGHIHSGAGISSITHGATGQYVLNVSTVFSRGTQAFSGPVAPGTFYRSVPSFVLIGFEANVAYSDPSVRVLAGASATTTSTATYQMNFQAVNNSAKAHEDVYRGSVVIVEHTD